MSLLNWFLAACALCAWAGPVLWYFKGDIRTYWSRRHDKWFRQ